VIQDPHQLICSPERRVESPFDHGHEPAPVLFEQLAQRSQFGDGRRHRIPTGRIRV